MFQSFVPDCQTFSAVPVEDLESIAASIDEQEQLAGREILSEAGSHQSGKCVESFAEIGRPDVEEDANGMTEG